MSRLFYAAKFIFLRLFHWNTKLFHGVYFNDDSRVYRVIKNILNPKRVLAELFYGQIIPLPEVMVKAKQAKGVEKSAEVTEALATLKKDGIVFLGNRFPALVDYLIQTYKASVQYYQPASSYTMLPLSINDRQVFDFLTDPFLLSVLAGYYGYQPTVRFANAAGKITPALISVAYPDVSFEDVYYKKVKSNYKTRWHYDTVNQMTIHVLLKDVDQHTTRMYTTRGQHEKHWARLTSLDYHHSEEFIRDRFEPVDLIGSKGEVILFNPNAPHRFHPEKDTCRIQFHINYTVGNNLPDKYAEGLKDPSWLDSLSSLQKNAVKHIV